MIEQGYLLCLCGKRMKRIRETDTISGIEYCRYCKKEFEVFITHCRVFLMKELED